MPDSDQKITSYLLGELSEAERDTIEEQYFDDPRIFDEVLKSESELVDGYVRGQLSAEARERFEKTYLAHPQRHERVKFAEALVARVDQNQVDQNKMAEKVAAKPAGVVSGWRRLRSLPTRTPILQFSLALATLLLVVGGVWFFIESRRSREELAQAELARADQEARVRELEQQVAAERKRAEELNAKLKSMQQALPEEVATPSPTARVLPTFASLILTVGGVRSGETGKTATMVIPAGTAEARLQLNLKEHDYTGYRVSVQEVGGPEIFSRGGLKPRITNSGASLSLTVPASKFATGDYILTLKGLRQGGEIEDLSKSIFHVEKR